MEASDTSRGWHGRRPKRIGTSTGSKWVALSRVERHSSGDGDDGVAAKAEVVDDGDAPVKLR